MSTKNLVACIIMCICILLAVWGGHEIMKANPPYDLYGDDMKIEDLAQNRYVDAEFMICEGPIVEVSWENEYGNYLGGEYIYVIPVYEGEKMYYMGVKLDKYSDYRWDKMSEQTENYAKGLVTYDELKTYYGAGYIDVLPDDEYAYLCKIIADSFGQKIEDVEKNVLRYVFEPYDYKKSKMKGICLIFIAGFGGLISLILFLIKIESRKEEKENG